MENLKAPNIRPYDPSRDYLTLCEWWRGWKQEPPPIGYLPISGWVVEGIAAGFLYFTNSEMAWADYLITNRNYKDRAGRKEAIALLYEAGYVAATKVGVKKIITSSVHPTVIRHWKTHGAVTRKMTIGFFERK